MEQVELEQIILQSFCTLLNNANNVISLGSGLKKISLIGQAVSLLEVVTSGFLLP